MKIRLAILKVLILHNKELRIVIITFRSLRDLILNQSFKE